MITFLNGEVKQQSKNILFTILNGKTKQQFKDIHSVASAILDFYKWEFEGGIWYAEELYKEMDYAAHNNFAYESEEQAGEAYDSLMYDAFLYDLDHLYDSKMEIFGLTVIHQIEA